MEITKELQDLREELIERYTNAQHFYVRVSTVLDLAEERVRRAEAEAQKRRLDIRTEVQVAEELHCHVDSVRRLRKSQHLAHTRSPGGAVLYTETQFLALLEAIERPAKLREAGAARRAS